MDQVQTDQVILTKAKEWVTNPYFDNEDKTEINSLIERNDVKELTERFYKDLEFGTGGLRAILGMGRNRINKYNIRKATQALVNEVLKQEPLGEDGKYKIAISYDSRRFSEEFAKETASVCAANGVHAYIYERLNPVCLLSWSVRYHKANAGVMVTASHNPPEYNGYKVYWSDGAQVTPPYDKQIITNFYSIESFEQVKTMDFKDGLEKGLIHWVGKDVEEEYFKMLHSKVVNPELCLKSGDDLKIVYTPIHGTGLVPCKKMLNEMGFNNVLVPKEQALPDGNFPTVKSPNPENPEAMSMAVEMMRKENADIVFGTDPDTDRLGVAVIKNEEVIFPTGNQIGLLMLHYILSNFQETGRMPANAYFVKTIVTTPLQEKIAKSFGLDVENTLTGFKWICGRMKEIEETQPHRNMVFATEESFGYMNHDNVRDKDGICSVALMAEVCLWYKKQNMDIIDALDKIYEEYGFSNEQLLCLDYFGKEGAEKISRIMEKFRQMSDQSICGDEITQIEDYKLRKIRVLENNEIYPITLPESNVLGYSFASGNKLYLRPSGTEPKIKFYIMIRETEGDLETKKSRARQKTDEFLAYIKSQAQQA